MKILDGRIASKKIGVELKTKISQLKNTPKLSILQVGDLSESNTYIKYKINKANELGVKTTHLKFDENISQDELIKEIKNISNKVDGLIVQLPLPETMDVEKVLNSVPYDKDIDGLSSENKLFSPATPRGIISLIKYYDIKIKNKIVAVVGQSKLVGSPVSNLLELEGAKEVIRLDINTGLKGTERADIIIAAAGHKDLIKAENIKSGVVIIDVGINTLSNGKITGDVDRNSVKELPSAISPVPGGVGPMTVISLFLNLYDSIKKN